MAEPTSLRGSLQPASGYNNLSNIAPCYIDSGIILEKLYCTLPYLQAAEAGQEKRIVLDPMSCNKPIRILVDNTDLNVQDATINGRLDYQTMDNFRVREYGMGPTRYVGVKHDDLDKLEDCFAKEKQDMIQSKIVRALSEDMNNAFACILPTFAAACNRGNQWDARGINLGSLSNPVSVTGSSTTASSATQQYIVRYLISGKQAITNSLKSDFSDMNIAVVIDQDTAALWRSSDDRTNYATSGMTGGASNYCKPLSDMCGFDVYIDNCPCLNVKDANGKPIRQVVWFDKKHLGAKMGKVYEHKNVSGAPYNTGRFDLLMMRYGIAVSRPEAVAAGYITLQF
jgi:hypothetical protein